MFWKPNALEIPTFGDAHLATTAEMEAASMLGPKGIRLGYYREPGDRKIWGRVIRYDGDGGLILVAPPRSGKARDVLVGALLEYDQSVIVVDPKGQLAAITAQQRYRMGQRIYMLNPFNVWPTLLGQTARYNPMALLDTASPTFGAECRKLAEGLVAKSDNERDSHWTDGARTLVSSVIGHLATDEDPAYRNLVEMREIVAGPEAKLLDFANHALKSRHAFIRQGLAEYAIENAPNKAEIAGKISKAREQTFFLSIDTIAENLRGDDFRFGVLKKEPTTVYVILPDEHLDTCGKWFRLIVASALHDLWRGGRGACRVLAILDEFAHIGHLDILEKAAGMAAGHGLQIWPVLQTLTQLRKDYGDNWETFIAGSEIRQFFGTRDQTSAKYVSETSGQRTVMTAGQSVQNTALLERHQSSDSVGQAGQPLVRPHEINAFGPNESLIFGPRNIVIDALRQPYFHTSEFAGLYSTDPQHAADAALPPAVNPENVITFADTHAAILERTARAVAARRPMFLRLLTWGSSKNPTVDILRKIEFLITLPLRLIGALVAAPFAMHNKPPGAVLVAVAFAGLSLFGRSAWEIHATKQTLNDIAKVAAGIDAVMYDGFERKDDEYYIGVREAELDAETRAGFFQFVRENGLGTLEDMTGFKALSGIRRLTARINHYQKTVVPVSVASAQVYRSVYQAKFSKEKDYELATRTPYARKLFLNAKSGCPSDVLPCTSLDPKVIVAYDARHPWRENLNPSNWLIFQGRDAAEQTHRRLEIIE